MINVDRFCVLYDEKVQDTKGIIRRRTSKDRQLNGQKKKDKRTTIYKTLHKKLMIDISLSPIKLSMDLLMSNTANVSTEIGTAYPEYLG
jgi:hypothetical protein